MLYLIAVEVLVVLLLDRLVCECIDLRQKQKILIYVKVDVCTFPAS